MFGNNNNKKSNGSIFAAAGKVVAKSTVGINPLGAALTSISIMNDAISEAEKAEDRRRREAERKAAAARSTYSAGFSNGFGSGYAAAKSSNYSNYSTGYNSGYNRGYNAAKREQQKQKAEEPKYNSSIVSSSLSENYMKEFIRSFSFVNNEDYQKISRANMLNEDGYNTGVFKAWRTGDTVYRLAARGADWKLYVTVVNDCGYMVLAGANIDDVICVASETGERFETHLNYEVSRNYAISEVAKAAYQTMQLFF